MTTKWKLPGGDAGAEEGTNGMKLWQQFAERGQQRERDTRKFSSTNGVRAGAWLAAALLSAPFAHAQNTGTTLQPPEVSGTNVTINWNSGSKRTSSFAFWPTACTSPCADACAIWRRA